MEFLGLSGSLRRTSTNTMLLQAMAMAAPEGTKMVVYDEMSANPLFNPDLEPDGLPEVIARFVAECQAVDGLVIAAPEYAHGIPGALKNALDWLVSDTLVPHKPVMLVHASTRSFHSRNHLREVLTTMSLSLFPGPEMECNLMGATPQAAQASLNEADVLARMREALGAFEGFIRTRG